LKIKSWCAILIIDEIISATKNGKAGISPAQSDERG